MQCVFDNPVYANGGCIFADPSEFLVPIIPPTGLESGRGSGPTHGIRKEGYKQHRESALLETRRRKILQEDNDIIALIISMLTRNLM